MKVTSIRNIENTERDVLFEQGKSLRLILEKDKMGFSFHKTIIRPNETGHWHYKNHLEACFCIKGTGILTNLNTKESFLIEPDTIYLLDDNDNHTFKSLGEEVVLLSVFNPPCKGNEIHKEDGSYEANT
jgi:L-ectoine synthase